MIILIENFELLGIIGIALSMLGFILMLCFWKEPDTSDVNHWKKYQRIGRTQKEYEARIKDDFPWYFDPVTNERLTNNWLVPKGFTDYWKLAKIFSFFCIIIGFFLHLLQLVLD